MVRIRGPLIMHRSWCMMHDEPRRNNVTNFTPKMTIPKNFQKFPEDSSVHALMIFYCSIFFGIRDSRNPFSNNCFIGEQWPWILFGEPPRPSDRKWQSLRPAWGTIPEISKIFGWTQYTYWWSSSVPFFPESEMFNPFSNCFGQGRGMGNGKLGIICSLFFNRGSKHSIKTFTPGGLPTYI